MMGNFSVKTRLIAGFGLIILSILVVAAFSVMHMTTLYTTTEELATHDMVLLQHLSAAQEAILQQGNSIRDIVAQEDLKIHREARKVLKEKHQGIASHLKEMQAASTTNAQELTLRKNIAELLTRFDSELQTTLSLVEDAEYDDAKSHVFYKVRVTQNALSAAFEKYIALKMSEAEKLSKSAKNQFQNATRLIVIITTIATIAGALLAFLTSRGITEPLSKAVTFAKTIAAGDLTRQIESHGKDEIAALLKALGIMNKDLSDTLRTVKNNGDRVGSLANDIASKTTQVSGSTQDQADRASRVSQAMTEMSSSVQDISESTQKVSNAAMESQKLTQQGNQLMQKSLSDVDVILKTVNASSSVIGDLNLSINRISDVASVIKDIAEQTNLLALNAAIEAARAGEQGRGFAVVADEVRKLAERTSSSTSEIAETVATINNKAAQAVNSMDSVRQNVEQGAEGTRHISELLTLILQSTSNVHELATHIANATQEQSIMTEQTASDMEQMASTTEETHIAVQQVQHIATEMNQMASALNILVARFQL